MTPMTADGHRVLLGLALATPERIGALDAAFHGAMRDGVLTEILDPLTPTELHVLTSAIVTDIDAQAGASGST